MEAYIRAHHLEDSVRLWGYQTNPYRFISRSDVYVCSSFIEGLSVAATEAVLLGKACLSPPMYAGRKSCSGTVNTAL